MKVVHRKTRKQKIIADYRRSLYSLENKNTSFNIPVQTLPVNAVNKKDSYSYTHVVNDIFKTSILTICIIAAQIILFFLLKNHVLKIPGIIY